MDITATRISETQLFDYKLRRPFFVEECKDLLNVFRIKPSSRNGLILAFTFERREKDLLKTVGGVQWKS